MKKRSSHSLKFFIEKYDRLTRRSFTKFFLKRKELSLTTTFPVRGKPRVQFKRPTEESIDAFLLTFRLFLLKNDGIAMISLGKILDDDDISQDWKNKFIEIRKQLDDYLDSQVPFVINGESPTRKYLLEMFLYGHYAHLDEKKMAVIEKWKQDPLDFPDYELEFIVILISFHSFLNQIAEITRMELGMESIRSK